MADEKIVDEIRSKGDTVQSMNLEGADLIDADLSGVNLIGADLSGADFSGANLRDVDFSGANVKGTLVPKEWAESINIQAKVTTNKKGGALPKGFE